MFKDTEVSYLCQGGRGGCSGGRWICKIGTSNLVQKIMMKKTHKQLFHKIVPRKSWAWLLFVTGPQEHMGHYVQTPDMGRNQEKNAILVQITWLRRVSWEGGGAT